MRVLRVFILVTVFSPLFHGAIALAEAPTTMVYQGRLSNQAGAPITGAHTVTFRIYATSAGGTSLWTETLPVTADANGLFTVELGAIDPIDESLFDGSKRYLGLSLDAGLEMTPRQLMSSTAYAVGARMANVADGSITGAKLANGAVATAHIADGTVGSADLADGAVVAGKLAANAVTSDRILDATITSTDIADGAINSQKIAAGAISSGHIANHSIGSDDIAVEITLGNPSVGSGALYLKSGLDLYTIIMGSSDNFGGLLYTYDGTGRLINGMNSDNGNVFGSHFSAYNAEDNLTAGINGETGEVFGNLKSFVVADPTQSGRVIQYSSVEGPEAAIYCRGQVELVAGAAHVAFPEHFSAMAAPGTMTVTLTPRSLLSKGVAAVNVSTDGMDIGELQNGNGSYAVDYVIYAVRKGFEDYQVYRTRNALHSRDGQLPTTPKVGE